MHTGQKDFYKATKDFILLIKIALIASISFVPNPLNSKHRFNYFSKINIVWLDIQTYNKIIFL